MEGSNSTPDLQSILSTLARYAPPVQTTHPGDSGEITSRLEEASFDGSQRTTPRPPTIEKPEDPRLRPQSRSAPSPRPIDPATITTWQDGLRCVTKIAAQNAQFAASIREMIAEQRKNELRWHSERQALKQTQAKRSSSSAQALSILQSLGSQGTINPLGSGISVDNHAEIAAFDRKIYTSQQEMDSTMTAQLKALGVPFFGTEPNLVVMENDLPGPEVPSNDRPKWSPVVSETQMLELRRRMVGHLEDLYRD